MIKKNKIVIISGIFIIIFGASLFIFQSKISAACTCCDSCLGAGNSFVSCYSEIWMPPTMGHVGGIMVPIPGFWTCPISGMGTFCGDTACGCAKRCSCGKIEGSNACNLTCDEFCAPPCESDGSCDCTAPACPTGYTETNNGCAITTSTSCSGEDDCGDSCSDNRKCYLIEPNTTFIQSNGSTDGPSSVSMIVDDATYVLSTNPNNPTHIKLPANGSSDVQVSVPTFTAPTTSRGANYYFQANNYGVNDEWKTWTTCSGVDGEDFCTTMPNSNNTQPFVPTSKTVTQVLKENAMGQISAKYATTDKCTDTYKYSVAIEGYYVVDDIPEPPIIVDPEDLFPDITTDVTTRGCSSLTYTGQEINNPLHVVASSTDPNGNDEIQAMILWLSKDNTVPATGTITGTYSGSSNQDLGIMIRKNGSNWSNPYIYVTNTSPFTFAQLNGEYITVNGSNIARIYEVSVTQDTDVTFDYKIEFLPSTENLSGMYNVYGGVLDSYMINGATIDQSYLQSLTDWGIDLVNPTVNDITQEVKDPANTYITWSVVDTISGIGRTVMNAYRTGGLSTSDVTLYIPTAYTVSKGLIQLNTDNTIPDEEQIGLYNDTNAWTFGSSTGEKDMLNIGGNESGNIYVYATPYDLACNTGSASENIDLNPWFATRGGTVYSTDNITSAVKNVSSNPLLEGVFNPKTQMTKEKIDLGTELLATTNTITSNLIHPELGTVRALSTEDSNYQRNYWYTQLLRKFDMQKSSLTSFTKSNSDESTKDSCTGTNCYMYSTENISIHSGYTCDVPTLFISEKDIYVEPNIQSESNLSGCMFLAKNNIYIGDGGHISDTKVKYDYVEGFFIADNQIIFSLSDGEKIYDIRDGIEIFGGLVAFGTNISNGSAVSIERNMRLFNQTNPTLVVTYDNKYANLSYIFFGTFAQLYKQEVGFKTGD